MERKKNNEVMSIGVVFADAETFQIVSSKYYIITPEYLVGGMYSGALQLKNNETTIMCSRIEAIYDLLELFKKFGISSVFAYNASFDRNHLPELTDLTWYDIMRLAAYRQYNSKIPQNAECYRTGRLKRNYGVEPIFRMLTENNDYRETHNALYDALDELKIMQLLGNKLEKYDCAIIGSKKAFKCEDIDKTFGTNTFNEVKTEDSIYSQIPQEKKLIVSENTEKAEAVTTPKFDISSTYNDSDETCTVSDIVKILGVSSSTVYNLINKGEIPATKKSNKYIILIRDVRDYIERKKRARQVAVITSLAAIGLFIIFYIILLNNLLR